MLLSVVRELRVLGSGPIVIVDDGSDAEFERIFEQASLVADVHVVRHCTNLGKGAALKTGMNYAMAHFRNACGVVTADADGQHHPEDILAVLSRLTSNPGTLVLGARRFDEDVPFRSKLGNGATRILMRLVVGQNFADTQTGLRGIPAALVPHLLRLPSSGYEFELDMLLACKHQSCPIVEEPIRTIYLDGNKSSHFRPLADSMRIYFLLFRFSLLSILTALIDNAVFAETLALTSSIGWSQIAGRVVAMVFNYPGARRVVFHSKQTHRSVLPKYIAVVLGNGLLSYALIHLGHYRLGVPTIVAKLAVEGLLFLLNFLIQRDLVFTKRAEPPTATNWDLYYTSVPKLAQVTRRYTNRLLLNAIRRHASSKAPQGISIVEIGGANSCFMNNIMREIPCRSYDIIDTNEYGLSLLKQRVGTDQPVRLHCESVLDLKWRTHADVVFSVGLVEHFDLTHTRDAVLAHFDLLRPGGVAIITFPTPTFLYCAARRLIELVGMWKFHDERPLLPAEVVSALDGCADVLQQKTMWPLILTQHVIVAQRRACGSPTSIAVVSR